MFLDLQLRAEETPLLFYMTKIREILKLKEKGTICPLF